MANLTPIGSNGLVTITSTEIVDRVADWRAAMVAVDTAINNGKTVSVNGSKTYTDAAIAASKFTRPYIEDGTDWNTVTATGAYPLRYATPEGSGARINAPSNGVGTLLVFNSQHPTLTIAVQLFLEYAGGGMYMRSQASSGAWVAWKRLDTVDAGEASAHRAMLVSAFKARRGGKIGTSGRIPVALRFDHGLANFRTKILPLLRKYDLPWSQAINSNQMGNTGNNSSFAEFQGWAINDGGEAWNHSRNHAAASGTTNIRREIVTALAELTAGLPSLAIEGWAPPGVGDGNYDGYSPMQTLEQHWGTYAGQTVLAYHAAVAGYLPGLYRPMPADLQIGLGHTTIEAQTPAWVAGVLRGAINAGMGVQLMLHPIYIDSTGYMSSADIEAVFADLSERRAAGEIEILTPSGMLVADPTSDHRDDLASNGMFRSGLTSWSNTAGWVAGTVSGVPCASTSTGTPLTQTVGLGRKEALRGGVRELVYQVRATAGAVVRTSVTGAGVDASKDRTLPASSNWVEVRKPVTIPLDLSGDLTVAVGRVSGGPVDITNVRLQSI